ncbi:PucR family transcriptional regulator ligand-binding domain-containing protein [Rhodococcus sp. BP-332]|uniref:PucR family transcriptional regulator n=1 Tax=Rhodococcus sp. BP-332 TaxID=2739447 RepID=UPI001C9B0ADC|nr:PucR family transcriptional regulator ligand-binding domain-containing protein [Rhodococcus sp. BP-332]MBY6678070.1 PucR family transcriptional regulator ligand-binding domain-containing protein [Rhodococcus sp. BP-332]
MLIQDVLDVPELALRRLVGTDDQLGRTVRWAFATDLPDPSRYIVGGELVVTGMVWRRAPEDSDAFVASVVAAGAVALAAGDEVFGSVPDDVVRACEKYSLPLLAVPSAVAFADVIDAVTSRVTGDRVARLSASLARQHRLLTAVTDGRALADLTHETARDTGVTCRIITAVGRPVVSAEPLAAEVVDALVRTAAQGVPCRVVTENTVRSVLPVGSSFGHRATAWYLVVDGDHECLDGQVLDALGQLSSIAALDRVRVDDGARVLRTMADRAAELLVDGSGEQALERIRQIGVDVTGDVVALAATADLPVEVLAAVLTDAVRESVDGAVSVGVTGGDLVIGVVGLPPGRTSTRMAADLALALRRLADTVTGRIAVGVGTAVEAAALVGCVRSAQHAREVAAASADRIAVRTSADTGSAAVLLSVVPDGLRAAYARRVLGSVLDHDSRTDAGLLDTLRAYLHHDGSWSRTADALHVHVNTVRYRIGRVEALTDRDLGTTEDRTDVFVALAVLGPQPTTL